MFDLPQKGGTCLPAFLKYTINHLKCKEDCTFFRALFCTFFNALWVPFSGNLLYNGRQIEIMQDILYIIYDYREMKRRITKVFSVYSAWRLLQDIRFSIFKPEFKCDPPGGSQDGTARPFRNRRKFSGFSVFSHTPNCADFFAVLDEIYYIILYIMQNLKHNNAQKSRD